MGILIIGWEFNILLFLIWLEVARYIYNVTYFISPLLINIQTATYKDGYYNFILTCIACFVFPYIIGVLSIVQSFYHFFKKFNKKIDKM